ncbi:DUF4238 domain-containing protein [Geomesophilobacter sediminis]|uniref:DUF4238 domain-containing protein n=1 Tax=Geomesophilobacter sediminis TaxID=2798584 RepID=A0A8J7LYK2_9BACT|nr:DUF4238 domain-containing protein [Geomesophilobacter sediminis]MBJ6724942.1 DUF4238 domain-containing protein [Geomesophilobacter sediminis]
MGNKRWNEKKNQHYVPQGYLRKFTIPNQKSLVWSCDKPAAQFSKTTSSVNRICARDYYYYQIEENGDVDHVRFEDSLSEVERVGMAALNKIIGASAMPYADPGGEQQGHLAFFLALLLTRGPSFRDAVNDLHGWWVQHSLQQLYHSGELPTAPPPLHKLIEDQGINNVIKTHIYSYASLEPLVKMAEDIALTMLKKGWLLYRPPEGHYFVTSDTPVVFSLAAGSPYSDVGPAHPSTEFTIPLSKGLMLIISPAIRAEESFMIKTATVEEWYLMNTRVIAAANDSIFSSERAEWIVDLAKRFGNVKQTLVIEAGAARSFQVIDHPFRSKV